MKKSAILVLCLGFAAGLSACNESKSPDKICENVADNTYICHENVSVLCVDGDVAAQEPCPFMCSLGHCGANSRCSGNEPVCDPDGKNIVSCENGIQKTTACECGCENAACKSCGPVCDCSTLENCTEEEKAVCQKPAECDCATGANCTEEEKAACPCYENQTKCETVDGISTEYSCMNMGASGFHGAWAFNKDCEFGCNGDKCAESAGAGCDYQGSKCSADGNASLYCEGGIEKSEDCSCGCDSATGVCKMCEVTCNCKTKEGCTAEELAKCQVTPETCNCSTGANCTEEEKAACKAKTCIDIDEFEYENGEVGCITETRVGICINGNWEEGKNCAALGGECILGECVDESGDLICDYSGYVCGNDDTEVFRCNKGSEELVEKCILGCTDGACNKVACDKLKRPECADNWSKLVCSGEEVVKEACGEGLLCVEGECVKQNASVECTFTAECSADGRSIRKCSEGNVTTEDCDPETYCDDTGDAPACVSALDSGRCTIHYNDYCVGDTLHYCNFDSQTLETGSVENKACGKNRCVNNQCVSGSQKEIGDDCTVENYRPTCIGEIAVKCDQDKKKVVKVEDCAELGMICGIVTENEVQASDCYEKCDTKGEQRGTCTVLSDSTYQSKYECIDIGNGRFGLEMMAGTWVQCDIGCKEGKCYDYTEGIENAGESCTRDEFDGYCKDDSRAVNCEPVDNGDQLVDVVTVEKCFFYETCKVSEGSNGRKISSCASECKPDDPVKYECVPGTGLFAGNHMSYKYACAEKDGSYSYIQDPDYVEICLKGCAEDGTCNP